MLKNNKKIVAICKFIFYPVTMNVSGFINILEREKVDEILFSTLKAVYRFERNEVEEFDLTYQQIYLLKILKRNSPMRISDIAEELRIQVFAATRLVDQLEKRRYIKRNRDRNDRRNILVSISRPGIEMVQKIEDHAYDLVVSNLHGYNEVEINVMIDLILNLEKILGVQNEDILQINKY